MNKLEQLILSLPKNSNILDYGCYKWPVYALSKKIERTDLHHHGCDLDTFSETPNDAQFHLIDPSTNQIYCDKNSFDMIVLSHVIEHSQAPLKLFEALLRVCKPGGVIYIEAPSDRSLLVKSDPNFKSNSFLSFWDDPTHIRPWTPAAFYRLALSYDCELIESKYITSIKAKLLHPFKWLLAKVSNDSQLLTDSTWAKNGWLCYAVIKKPHNLSEVPQYKYVSLKEE